MRPGLTRTVLAVATIGLVACGVASDADVEAGSGLDGPDRMLAWERQPVYTVGGAEAEGWSAFGEVEEVAFDAAGNLYVLDQQASTVQVVAPDGSLLRSVGSPGQGPGELGQTMGMTVLADGTVAVFDISKFGMVVYGPDGTWIRDVRVDPQSVGLLTPPFVPLPDRSFAAQIGGRVNASASVQAEPGRPVVRIPLDANAAEPSTILTGWEPPEPESDGKTTTLGTSGGSVMLQMQRLRGFTPALYMAVLRDGRLLTVDSTTYRIGVYTPDGTLQLALSRPIEPVPVDPSIEDQERDRRLKELEASPNRGTMRIVTLGGSGGGTMQAPDMSEMMKKRIEDMIFYPEIQVIEKIAADWNDRIWVQRASGKPGTPGPTDIITPDEKYLGTLPPDGLRIPDAFGPDGLAVWIERDEFDAQRLVVARIRPAG